MPSIKTISAFLIAMSFVTWTGGANGEEAPASGGGPSNTEFVEYTKRLNKMTQLQTKVNDGTARLKDLIAKKNSGVSEIKDDKNNRHDILKLIVEQHNALENDYKLYNEELRAITYRFPSKGEEINRKYIPLRPKTLQQVEREIGLEGDLTALKLKVDDKYKVFNPPEEPQPTPTPKAQESTLKDKNAEKPQRLKLSR